MSAARKKAFDSVDEIFPNHAADASAVDFDDFFARGLDEFAVYPFGTELVFDDGDFLIREFSEEMVEEGGFSASKEAGEYGDGYRRAHGYLGQFGQTGTWISFFETVHAGSELGWTSDTWPQAWQCVISYDGEGDFPISEQRIKVSSPFSSNEWMAPESFISLIIR